MAYFKIVSRWDAAKVLYEGEAETLKDLVGTAVKSGANMDGANLYGASLSRANLYGANLSGASLDGASLDGANLYGANLDGASLSRANLDGASLSGANLARASLSGASLDGASLDGASLDGISGEKLTLVGTRPYFEISPIGSRSARLVAWMTDGGVWVRAGCWWGTLKDFKARIKAIYPTGQHGDEYRAAIRMVECHARAWAVDAAMSAKE